MREATINPLRTAWVIVTDVFLRVPIGAGLRRVSILGGGSPEILPVMGVDTSWAVVFWREGTEERLKVKNEEIGVFGVIVKEF